jgi:DNA-binding transcriptional MocR family regulator
MIKVDRDGEIPLGEQIADGVAGMIQRVELAAGARMPSVRQLAAQLSVSAFTVSGSYDRRDAPESPALEMPPSDPIGFALHCLDATGASLTRVAKGRNALLAASPAQGSRELRQQLSEGLRARGIPAAALDSGRYQRHVLRLRSKLALFRQRRPLVRIPEGHFEEILLRLQSRRGLGVRACLGTGHRTSGCHRRGLVGGPGGNRTAVQKTA